jgi:hypothetical protein
MTSEMELEHKKLCAHQDMQLVELWILAEKLLMDSLANFVIDVRIRIQQRCGVLATSVLHYLYKNTAIDSALRRFVVAQYSDTKMPKPDINSLPPEFLFSWIEALQKEIQPKNKLVAAQRLQVMKTLFYLTKRNSKQIKNCGS